ncbi:MAG: hypothetical protein HGA45_12115 [Chloroflexales bacterium]|nr:hypothetical protein [Chloroflexales bacterium]
MVASAVATAQQVDNARRPEQVEPRLRATPTGLVADMMPEGQYRLVVSEGLYAAQRAELKAEIDQALDYVGARFADPVRRPQRDPASPPFTVVVMDDPGCRLSGFADHEIRTVQVFTCESIGRDRAVSILAHELIHQLASDRYAGHTGGADMILVEGLATWGAGMYWLGGDYKLFHDYVRDQRAGGVFYDLRTSYLDVDTSGANALYYQWASFVEFLVDRKGGWQRFDELYVTGNGHPGSADYQGVYSQDFVALKDEWQAWLSQ